MIKQIAKDKTKLIFLGLLVFLFTFFNGINLAIALFLIFLCIYLKFRQLNIKSFNLLNITLLFLIIFVSSYFIIREGRSIFYIPFSLIPMLTMLLFNSLEISLLITFATAVSVSLLSGDLSHLVMLFSISGIAAAILVRNTRKRTTIIHAGLIVGILQAIILIFLDRFIIQQPIKYIILMLNGIASSIIVLGVLPVFEYLFKTVTNISLLELADFHHPLLQSMILEAPGTYHHSLVVGNLSETACAAVGANALLARIGSYYHDIGKLQKPEYFSENQDASVSKHDTLRPTMSKLIIMNHIKEGVELAKKYRLNPSLIDFKVADP